MSVLGIASRPLVALLAASFALLSVGCQGADAPPQYTGSDLHGNVTGSTIQAIKCESGSTQTCTIWLGQHGDLSNCVHGLDVCSDGAWTGCIDDETLAANPDLYDSLAGDR